LLFSLGGYFFFREGRFGGVRREYCSAGAALLLFMDGKL